MSLSYMVNGSKLVLLTTGIWPQKTRSSLYDVKTICVLLMTTLLSFCMFVNVSDNFDNMFTLSESVYISIVNSVVKEIVLVFKRKRFRKLVDALNGGSFTSYLDVIDLRSHLNIIKNVNTFMWIQVVGCLFFMTLLPVLGLQPLPLDFPYFNDGSFYYPFYVFQVVSLSICAFHNMSVDLLAAELMSVADIQLKILNKKLICMEKYVRRSEKYLKEDMDAHIVRYLKQCCIHYSDIEEFIKDTTDIFSIIIFVQIGTGAISICNAGVMLLRVDSISFEAGCLYTYVPALFVEIGIYCWFGNNVYIESQQIINSCYMSHWHKHGTKVRKTLFMLMERSKRPFQIKGVHFFSLTLNTFLVILKWSYSYFTLLKNFTADRQN